ncbi:hypothetical protein Tco_0825482 [Tanacetum coccineum]
MAASSSMASFSLDLYHNGYFNLKPLTYIDSEMVTINIDVTGFKFEDMKEYVETKTHSLVSGLYYFNKGKDLGDNILFLLKPGYDFDDSDDEFSDVASLDHLFEGEEEIREVRIKKRKSLEEKNKSNEDEDDKSRLVLHNDSDDNDHEIDPLFSNIDDDSQKAKVHVEPEINSDGDMPIMDKDEIVYDPNKRDYPIHDPNTHWKLRAVKMHNGNSWHIRILVDEHTCTRKYYLGCLVTSKWIARQYEDKIRMNPDLKVVDLQEMVMKNTGLDIYNSGSRARRIAVYNLKQKCWDVI